MGNEVTLIIDVTRSCGKIWDEQRRGLSGEWD